MRRSTERIVVSHAGTLPRPPEIVALLSQGAAGAAELAARAARGRCRHRPQAGRRRRRHRQRRRDPQARHLLQLHSGTHRGDRAALVQGRRGPRAARRKWPRSARLSGLLRGRHGRLRSGSRHVRRRLGPAAGGGRAHSAVLHQSAALRRRRWRPDRYQEPPGRRAGSRRGARLPAITPGHGRALALERALQQTTRSSSSPSPTSCTRSTSSSPTPASCCRSTIPTCPTAGRCTPR